VLRRRVLPPSSLASPLLASGRPLPLASLPPPVVSGARRLPLLPPGMPPLPLLLSGVLRLLRRPAGKPSNKSIGVRRNGGVMAGSGLYPHRFPFIR
jgi:hypothetical protein